MRPLAIALVLVLAACGDNLDEQAQDARIDGPPDMAPPNDGPCAMGRYLTGELVDLDSSNTSFAGVPGAVFMQRGGTATDTTSPNGRFEMCVPTTTSYVFDVDAPATHLDGAAYFDVEAITGTRLISLRGFTPARATSFYDERGLVYDATKAHVLVFVAGDLSSISLDRGHDTPQSGDVGTDGLIEWAPTGENRYVLFPNVDVANPTGTIDGDVMGDHEIPLAANEITYVAISWFFL